MSPLDGIDRRTFLEGMAASLALAGLDGCTRRRPEKILPYADERPDGVPGEPHYYATSMVLGGYATGLLVKSYDGRPIKIEGHPGHPASLGGTGVFEQASLIQLYDPLRAGALTHRAIPTTWSQLAERFTAPRDDRGAGLRFLLEPTSSPLVGRLIEQVRERHPQARFAFTREWPSPARHYDFSRADVVLALDADFLGSGPFSLRYARDFAARRHIDRPSDAMNRLYAVDGVASVTGTMADHLLRRRSSEVGPIAASIAAELLRLRRTQVPAELVGVLQRFRGYESRFARVVAQDLHQAGASSLVLAGDRQPIAVQHLAHLLNQLLGSDGTTSWLADPALIRPPGSHTFAELISELAEVETLVILDGNPVYAAPADWELPRRISAVPESLYLGSYADETARQCHWHVPLSHYLESWGDARAYDGTVSLLQPLIEPLHGGRTLPDLLALFAGDSHPDGYRLLRHQWQTIDDETWHEALGRGLFANTALPRLAVPLDWTKTIETVAEIALPPDGLEVNYVPSPTVYDGRFANNPWLIELPQPLTKLSWGNAALLAPSTAARLGLRNEQRVQIAHHGRHLELPIQIVPTHADDAITLHLGWGRDGAEALARGVGANANLLRTSDQPHFSVGAKIRRLPGRLPLAREPGAQIQHDRPIALALSLAHYREDPSSTIEREPLPSLMPPSAAPADSPQWAMSIDLSLCTGCSACVVACQAENNILVVGAREVQKGRAMHWLRIDTYFEGERAIHQPMMCQHCEMAPCEYVCPTNATVHSPDGLNEMVYNRCVGTRFCSNNCPYKVRRFNYFNWIEHEPANQGPVELQRNPDVTVRERGVMEKCTYCVQRIRTSEIQARLEQRPLRTGEVETACQQACPARAIQFDSLHHCDSKMAEWRSQPRAYSVLGELGTRPRTQYLARIDNLNPQLR